MQTSLLSGVLVSAAMAVSGYLSLRWAANKSQPTFTSVLLGGFLFRLALVGIALVWVWKFSGLDGKLFTWALLVSYLIFQVTEAIVFQRYFKRMKLMNRNRAVVP